MTALTEPIQDTSDILKAEIESASEARRATSRHALAEMLTERLGIPGRDALAIVDVYCDVNNPGIPDYMASEFKVGWLKVLAGLNVAAAFGLFYFAVKQSQAGVFAWPAWAVGVIICGLGVLAWVKSLEDDAARRTRVSKETTAL